MASNYSRLIRIMKCKDESDDFKNVNVVLDDILGNVIDKKQELKILKCRIEGENNESITLGEMSIAYALLIGLISLFGFKALNIFVGILFFLGAGFITLNGIKKEGYKKLFILQVINFRLEELEKDNSIKGPKKIEHQNKQKKKK